MSDGTKSISIRITEELLHNAKIIAAIEGESFNSYVIKMLNKATQDPKFINAMVTEA